MDAKSAALVLVLATVGCARGRGKSDASRPSTTATAAVVPPSSLDVRGDKPCIVHLHGKSGKGKPTTVIGGITHVRPNGNAPGWDGFEWLYFPEPRYEEVRAVIAKAVADAGCGRVIVHGFSNGGGAAAKLFCRGERFGTNVVGYVLDDPVPDHGVEPCAPLPGVKVRVYWTGALAVAADGWRCSSADWTCDGDSTIGIARYAKILGAEVTPSIHTKHEEYEAPPEYSAWW